MNNDRISVLGVAVARMLHRAEDNPERYTVEQVRDFAEEIQDDYASRGILVRRRISRATAAAIRAKAVSHCSYLQAKARTVAVTE